MGTLPRTQAATHIGVKFPVICIGEFNFKLLDTILRHDQLVLVAKPDLSEILSSQDGPLGDSATTPSFVSPFIGELFEQRFMEFMNAAQSKDGISSKAFLVFDNQTRKDNGTTCQVSTYHDLSDKEDQYERVPFRCMLSSAVAALQALEQCPNGQEHPTARAMRNQAAIASGIWSQESAAEQEEKGKSIRFTPVEYPQSEAWDIKAGFVAAENPLPYVPIFRTANISLETLNAFIQEAYGNRAPIPPTTEPYTVAIVTSLDYPFHPGPGPAQPPLAAVPPLPSRLLDITPSECNTLVRHLFPPREYSELNYNHFIIMDALTEETRTVLLACNCEFQGRELQVLRSNFICALTSLLAPDETILTMESISLDAVSQGDGVLRW